jgi:hypothetical protein
VIHINHFAERISGKQITLEQVKAHVQEPPPVSERGDDSQSRILTFTELQQLIQSGKMDQIPNNKVIPDKLNVGLLGSLCRLLLNQASKGKYPQRIQRPSDKEALGANFSGNRITSHLLQ